MLTNAEVEQLPLVRKIRAHEREMLEDKPPCGLEQCPRCREARDAQGFRRHEIRRRTFLVVAGNLVHTIRSCLSRWKCTVCSKPFTVYPPFVLPYKRYTLPEMAARSQSYIQRDELTYRSGVLEKRRPVFRAAEESASIDERCLAASTLHRWISAWACLPETLRVALGMIKQAAPNTGLFRDLAVGKVHPRKYRSEARRIALARCGQLIRAMGPYERMFSRPVFPNLATAAAWR